MSSFPRVRRRAFWRRIIDGLRRRRRPSLLDFEEVRDRCGCINQSHVGLESIPVDAIAGSFGRAAQYDRDFVPRDDRIQKRWERLERAYPGGAFPPIEVYKIGEAYFVADGHHRVAIARERKMEFIDAWVTEIHTSAEITPDTDPVDLLYLEQKRLFHIESRLGLVRPHADIDVLEPEAFPQMLEVIRAHGFTISEATGEVVSSARAAADWYDNVYRPAVEILREERLPEAFPYKPEGSLYLWVRDQARRWLLGPGPEAFRHAAARVREMGHPEHGRLRREMRRRGQVPRRTEAEEGT